MEIRSLRDTKLEALVECLLDSFSNYYVQMPADVDYWKNRFRGGQSRNNLWNSSFTKAILVTNEIQ